MIGVPSTVATTSLPPAVFAAAGAVLDGAAAGLEDVGSLPQPRVANPNVLAIRVAGEKEKQFLISAVPDVFFTEPHYNGFPAVLVRLEAIGPEELRELLLEAWRIQAPKALTAEFDGAAD